MFWENVLYIYFLYNSFFKNVLYIIQFSGFRVTIYHLQCTRSHLKSQESRFRAELRRLCISKVEKHRYKSVSEKSSFQKNVTLRPGRSAARHYAFFTRLKNVLYHFPPPDRKILFFCAMYYVLYIYFLYYT